MIPARADARRVLVPTDLRSPPHRPRFGERQVRWHGSTMGTDWQVTAFIGGALEPADLEQRIRRRLDGLVDQLSHWVPTSAVGRYNRAPAGRVALPPALFRVLSIAVDVARVTEGACDPTLGALVDLWGFGPDDGYRRVGFAPPQPAAIEHARRQCGWARLDLDLGDGSALQPGGLRLDLSGIGKGHAVDEIAGLLDQAGVGSHLVEIGGEWRGTGVRPDGQPWWIGLEAAPDDPHDDDVIALADRSIATSGDSRRGFVHQGRRYAHTIDPGTGRPVGHDSGFVSVVHAQAVLADAWATALTVLGPDVGRAVADRHRIAARWRIRTDGRWHERTSAAFEAMLA